MRRFRPFLLTAMRFALGLLVLLAGLKAAHQEGLELPSAMHTAKAAGMPHNAAFHKRIASKRAHHPVAPTKQKHRSAHRIVVAKIAITPAIPVCHMAAGYSEAAPLSLADVYRYLHFREITPPPPKSC